MGPRGKAAIKRYNVYRNNVTVSLINALADTYPAVQRITGVEFFRAMARFHVRATPPTSPLLFEYGRDFPAFIEGYEHAQDMPWLADTARIERAWLDAYHAADVPPLSPDVLAAVPSDRLGDLVFTAHPAARIVRSAYPAVTIFAMNRVEGPITPLRSNTAEDALITRPDMEVAVRLLPPGGAAFLKTPDRRRNVGSGCRHSLCRNALLRSSGQHRGHDRGRCLHHNSPRRSAMKPGNREERSGVVRRLTTMIDQAVGIIRWIAQPSLAQLMLRLALAVPFWKSGILKWNGFLQLNDTAIYLFTDEFKLHLPGGPYDFPAPAVMAFLSGCGEIIFPVLLVLGLGTRFAALGLLFMTCIVELTVPDGWPIHITWAAMALAIMAWGPGRLSIDHALCRLPGLRVNEAASA